MRKQLLITAFSMLTLAAHTFAQTIATVRTYSVGSTVTVTGIVINGTELGNIRYMEDATAGISIYGANLSTVNRGDSIVATGTLTSYNNLLEITPVTTFSVITTGRPLPAPFVITPNQMVEPYEGELVQINNCSFGTLGGGTFASNTNYNFTSATQTGALRISAACPLVGAIIPNQNVDLVGVTSQFCASPATGCTTGYQLIVRDANDLISTSSIWITSQTVPTNITTTGMTINWTTNIAGSYYINYGKTPNLELGTINGTGTSATPSVTITGATPATIYYAQVFSVNGTDTAKSSVKIFCTVSLSSGTIKTFFDRTVDTTVSTGTNAFRNTHIADTLAQYINRAKSTIEVTIYDWDNSAGGTAITNALNAAAARGVNIRIVYELSTPMAGLTGLSASIKKLPSPQGANYTIMHNKFVIIDANYGPNNSIVWTGATNWTLNQLSTDANNVIIFQDQSLARGYKLEFDEMWGDTSVTSSPNLTNSKFGQFKTDNTPHEYVIGGKRVESYFSPSDGTNTHILSTIGTANTDMYFGVMLITRSDLASKIASQITTNSLTSKGILDDTASASTAYFIMHNVMNTNLIINNSKYSWIFHHKYMIVDESNPSSDPLVLTGSHNWSNGADQKNDENTVIVHDATIANLYYQEFHQRWLDVLNGAGIIEINNQYGTAYVYPNPASNAFSILLDKNQHEKATISVFNMLGKEVASFSGLENNNGLINCADMNLANGVYLMKISVGGKLFSSRIVINH